VGFAAVEGADAGAQGLGLRAPELEVGEVWEVDWVGGGGEGWEFYWLVSWGEG
jgi:hypothetical protein